MRGLKFWIGMEGKEGACRRGNVLTLSERVACMHGWSPGIWYERFSFFFFLLDRNTLRFGCGDFVSVVDAVRVEGGRGDLGLSRCGLEEMRMQAWTGEKW